MKYTVKIRDVVDSEIDIDAATETEAVAIAHEMFSEGTLPNIERPWTHTTFTCGSVTEDEWTQSMI